MRTFSAYHADRPIPCSRKRVARLMRENSLQAKIRKRFKVTTNSDHKHSIANNLLNQNFIVAKPNTVWASDISYVRTTEGFLYLAVVMDLYSRKVVGWGMGSRMKKELVINAYLMAYRSRKPGRGLIHHSDRGSQYACKRFQAILGATGAKCSMSGKGNCYDNAVVESFFHTLKGELSSKQQYLTRSSAKREIFEYIEVFYNRRRRHSTIKYCTPEDFERQYAKEKVA